MQDREAVAFTEAPQSFRSLAKQRFRWTYGNLQALWKHRDMIGRKRYGFLGMAVLPYTILTILMPLFFTLFTYAMTISNLIAGDFGKVFLYFGIFTLVQLITAAIGIWLAHERFSLLLIVPFYRFIYDPLRIFLLYSAIFTALHGRRVGWNKLSRTGTVEFRPRKFHARLAPA